jgi:Fur family ferric uptake transcriptional regulator
MIPANAHSRYARPTCVVALQRLELAGLKNHPQRTAVIEAFFSSRGHVTAEDLALDLRAKDSRVSFSTVYRTLNLLVAHRLATARHFERGMTRYEPGADESHHDHLVCTRCGAIVEFRDAAIEAYQEQVGRRHGFEIDAHKMEIYGACARCRAIPRSEPS